MLQISLVLLFWPKREWLKIEKCSFLNGQIISTKRSDNKNEIIKFEQLNIDLANLTTTTIKKPKIQETSTLKLISCFVPKVKDQVFCKEDTKKEILPLLIKKNYLAILYSYNFINLLSFVNQK